jgi:methyl coenzyme M reductase subunit C
MKNGIRPLYTVPPIATNGSTKIHPPERKRAFSLRKKIILGSLIAVASGVGIWQLAEYQAAREREQFITWVAKYRPNWSPAMIKAQWDKIQYAKQHAEIAAPAPSPVAWHVELSAVPIPTTPPGRASAFGLTPDEYQKRMATHELTLGDVNRHNRGE